MNCSFIAITIMGIIIIIARFYWSINLGALISYTIVAYVCQYGAGRYCSLIVARYDDFSPKYDY